MTTWKFVAEGGPRVGAESALDACDYFVDEVIEPWKVRGKENESHHKSLGSAAAVIATQSLAEIKQIH